MKKEKSPISKKPLKKQATLPPQKSAVDTSNWEKRNFSATSVGKGGKRVQRTTFMWLTDIEL